MKPGPVAIIIGVAEYTSNELVELPSCVRDAQAIEVIIKHTARFEKENIFVSTGTVNSNKLKADLTGFFAARSGWDVDELFFYFSGHGEYTSNEFYYLLSDYDSSRLRQTSLEGSEFDNLVRNIKPKLYVKIIDACQSGLRYIKSRDDFDQYAKSLSSSFSNLYFMFSSLNEQYSFGGKDLSRFTRHLVKAVKDSDRDQLRYKDLIDAVSDAMVAAGQTPYFITQAQFTEVFCRIDKVLRDQLARFIPENSLMPDVKEKGETDEFFEMIKRDADRYATHDEVKTALNSFSMEIINIEIPKGLDRYYKLESIVQNKSSSLFKGIGAWLEQEPMQEKYFAEPSYVKKTRTKRVPIGGFVGVLSLAQGTKNYEDIQETYDYLTGFEHTVEVPYNFISIKALECLPNIDPAACFVVPIISKTSMRVFWGWYFYDYIDFQTKRPREKIDWQTTSIPIKNGDCDLPKKILEGFFDFLNDGIAHKWKAIDAMTAELKGAD